VKLVRVPEEEPALGIAILSSYEANIVGQQYRPLTLARIVRPSTLA
jgi:hypothetical protein